MERLTTRDIDGAPILLHDKGYAVLLDRLAAYEDTGLEPGEIKSLVAEFRVNLAALDLYRKAKVIKTNADKIRHLSDEELAAWFSERPRNCPLPYAKDGFLKGRCKMSCGNCWLDWLKQEVSE